MTNKKRNSTTILIVILVIVILGALIYLGKTIWFKADTATTVITNSASVTDSNGNVVDTYNLNINTP